MTEEPSLTGFAAETRALEDPRMARPLRRRKKPSKPRTRPNRHEEDDFSCAVKKLFRAVFDPEKVVFYAVPNGGRRDPIEGARLKDQGVLAGVYDWHIHWHGEMRGTAALGACTAILELKVGKNDRSDEQKTFGRRMIAIGHYEAVAWTLDDVIHAITRWGVPHRRIS